MQVYLWDFNLENTQGNIMITIPLTTDEKNLVKDQQLADSLKPQYYSSSTKKNITISDDFEVYLILQSSEQHQKGLTWIKTSESFEVANKDHDDLLTEYLDIRNQDAELRIKELDNKLNEYVEFQAGVLTTNEGDNPERFSGIIEVSVMTQALSKSISRIKILRDQAFHEQTMVNLLKTSLDAEKTNEETKKELSSWQNVLSAYPGQESKSGTKSDLGVAKLGI